MLLEPNFIKKKQEIGTDCLALSLWSLKNKEVFRIGLVDCPCVEP